MGRTIHHTELPPAQPGDPTGREWEAYRREVGRLLAEGHEGKWVLFKGDDIIGLFDSKEDADDEARRRYLLQGRLVHQIRANEPVVRTRLWW
jgi:hypothetical protein